MMSTSATGPPLPMPPLSALGAPSASAIPPPPAPAGSLPPLSAPSALGVFASPSSFKPVATPPRVAMEGKSLFTCHQCGALLKFKYSPVSIEDKIRRLRAVTFEHRPGSDDSPALANAGGRKSSGDQELEAATVGSDSDGTESGLESANMAAGRKSGPTEGASVAPPEPMIVPEIVWENQVSAAASDDAGGVAVADWRHAPFSPVEGVAAFYSCNRGVHGDAIADVVPTRLLNKPHLWLSPDWEVDLTLPQCDDQGWVYAASMDVFHAQDAAVEAASSIDDTAQERAVRRRRLVRKRQIDGSDLSWFQELLDCSSLLLQKKTPSCHDCEVMMLDSLQQTLDGLEEDGRQYEAFLSNFDADVDALESARPAVTPRAIAEDDEGEDGEGAEDWDADDAELRALEEEERQLLLELEAIQDETEMVDAKRRELWTSGRDLEQLIRGTFAEGAFLQHLLGLSRDERQSVGVFSVHASDMLRRLQRYNVCNDVFHIWHDGLFGTINGLRLGRLPSKAVEWVEINAALGQAVLLLATIAERANFKFARNQLIPRGSYSRVVSSTGKEYNLHSDGGMFRRRGFNQAMVLFLECVDDAGTRAMHEEPSLKFPYKISRGKIGDLPIILGNDEQWTKALKYMLTHLKWLLAWISKQYP